MQDVGTLRTITEANRPQWLERRRRGIGASARHSNPRVRTRSTARMSIMTSG